MLLGCLDDMKALPYFISLKVQKDLFDVCALAHLSDFTLMAF